ncbi:cyclopropane-fatty-acyl-phospholipid synthase family protein [Sphingomonas psychrotolerans]|uniref:Cyclopropane-fatty-acyl-phospholipid synthase family protein n=1 Tax=Sphingomonas psychrotolerans TaxID=1327635 RepID=A0ABU3N176_9SPHN|nr:cyclopropane-fatty-acyl-phospholipid synthase family protein [Sphingomonas psychrotolerans]MDT8757991.1 cyclopropane-fatty-acyl-phospholipid synthase family protein [Sphingomonas psychrotolerans]
MNAPTREQGRTGRTRRASGALGWLAPVFHRQLDRLDRGIAEGSLELLLPDGRARLLGGRAAGPDAVVDLRSWRALLRLGLEGSSGWYEAWAAGEWASPDPVQLFALFSRNRAGLAQPARATGPWRIAKRVWHWLRRNHRHGSRRNIEFHYDLGNDFYRHWLDKSMTYSSALFAGPGQSLEAAQQAKLQAMLDRTATAPGDAILEIGCGWGSFAELAANAGRRVHGITLSTEQKAWAEARTATLDGASFALTDYRDVTGHYDAVVSIEMAEAVGRQYWPAYLAAIARVLKPGGRAALQLITFDDALFEGYANNVDFIQRYIFPGGLLIRESEFRRLAATNGLEWRDQANFGLDYAETLKRWRANFDATAAARLLPAQFDARFVALWRYYLKYCEGGFRGGGIDVVQVTLVKEE